MQPKILIGAATSAAVLVTISQYLYILPVHISIFIITIAAVLIADGHAILWTLGVLPKLPKERMEWLHRIVAWGLWLAIVSGAILLWPLREFLPYELSFRVKMLLVATLIVNAFVIHQHMAIAFRERFAALSWQIRRSLLLSGVVSTVCWAGAFVAAKLLPV